MKQVFVFVFAILAAPLFAFADAVPGKPAPAFEVKDAIGKTYNLEAIKGKWAVLEWYNKDCPYVKKHYKSNNMQTIQKKYTEKGVVWLSVSSAAKGKEGFMTAAAALKNLGEQKSAATAMLMDESGAMGKSYGAKTTPHMYIINPEGMVVYAGGIDNNDSSDPKVIPQSKNFVTEALDLVLAGQPVKTAASKPYGCSVKY